MFSQILCWCPNMLWICFMLAQILCVFCGQPDSLPITLKVKHACNDSATLTYQPYPPLPAYPNGAHHDTFSCQLVYWSHKTPRTTAHVLYEYPMSQQEVTITNLTRPAFYNAFISCGQKFHSNNVTFTMKVCKDPNSSDEVYSTPILLENSGFSQMSSIDIVLGIIFGIFGAIILAAAGYYFWKNYQRRRRILRIFGQTHTDPFEALHNSTEESSIISL